MNTRFGNFDSTLQAWRDNEAALGHDPEGDRQTARENVRFLRDTYADGADYATPPAEAAPVKEDNRMQMSLNFGEVA